MRKSGRPRVRVDPIGAFINVPFDDEYEHLYLALIAGLSGFGLIPQSVLQIPGSQRRLDRILALIQGCRYSFHDICRVGIDTARPPTPRFNMPFELGLAVTWSMAGDSDHAWYVMEAKQYRQQKSLSDLNGTEIYIHDGRAVGVFRLLTNALARTEIRPTVPDLQAVYRDLNQAAAEIKKALAAPSLFDTRAFQDLVFAAGLSARMRVASLR
jgi:hypothetical protein